MNTIYNDTTPKKTTMIKPAIIASVLSVAPTNAYAIDFDCDNDMFESSVITVFDEVEQNTDCDDCYVANFNEIKDKKNRKINKKEFDVNFDDFLTTAKESGIILKYSNPSNPNTFYKINTFENVPNAVVKELKVQLKMYDDNKNNKLDKDETNIFMNDASRAVNKYPSGYSLTPNIFISKGEKKTSEQTTFAIVHTTENTKAHKNKKAHIKAPKDTLRDTTFYVYHPMTSKVDFYKNKIYTQSDLNPHFKFLGQFDKISFIPINESIDKKLKEPVKLAKSQIAEYNTLRKAILEPIKKLKPGETATFCFNQMENKEAVRGNLKVDKIIIYSVKKKKFNRLEVTTVKQ